MDYAIAELAPRGGHQVKPEGYRVVYYGFYWGYLLTTRLTDGGLDWDALCHYFTKIDIRAPRRKAQWAEPGSTSTAR